MPARPLLPYKVTKSQVLRIRVWPSIGGHYDANAIIPMTNGLSRCPRSLCLLSFLRWPTVGEDTFSGLV